MTKPSFTFTELCEVDLKAFGTAVDDWKKMTHSLQRISREARDGMQKKSESARWSGADADVTKPFVRQVTKEVSDLKNEASSVWHVISDAHRELSDVQQKVKGEKEAASDKGIKIVDEGDGTVSCHFQDQSPMFARDGMVSYKDHVHLPPEGSDNHSKAEYRAKKEVEEKLNRLLAKAGHIDRMASEALRKSRGNDRHNAGHSEYSSLAEAEAQRAKHLSKEQLHLFKEGKELPTTKLAELKEIFSYNGRDPEFATSYYRSMGQKDALRMHAEMGLDASTDGGNTRLHLASSVQHGMGVALGAATRSDGHGDTQADAKHLGTAWTNQLKHVGRERLQLSKQPGGASDFAPRGYQVLGNVLRHGKYDSKFINDVGNDMVAFEREHPGGASPWARPGPLHEGQRLSLDIKDGAGYDPMSGLMKGLSHNPEGANEFFRDSTGGGEHLSEKDNFTYFFGDEGGKHARKWYPDVANMIDPDNKDKVFGKDSMGDALEAAVTGKSPAADGDLPEHGENQAKLFRRVVDHFGTGDGQKLVATGGELESIADNLGDASAAYMHDIHRGIASDEAGLVGHHGYDPDLGNLHGERLDRFVRGVGQDPHAYAAMRHAQQAVSTESIKAAIADPAHGETMGDAAVRGSGAGAHVSGILAEGRADGIDASEDKVGKAEKFNENLATGDKWAGRIVDMGVSKIPVAGDAVGWAKSDIEESIVGHYKKDTKDLAEEVQASHADRIADARKDSGEAMKDALYSAAKQRGYSKDNHDVQVAADDVYDSVIDQYTNARPRN